MKIAVAMINLSPSVPLDFDVPDRVWKGKDVSYAHLRVFGCRAFVHVPRDERSKFDSKTKQCIFLGSEDDEFGYRLWDPKEKKIVRNKDVIFFEDQTIEDFEQKEKIESTTFIPSNSNPIPTPQLPLMPANHGGDLQNDDNGGFFNEPLVGDLESANDDIDVIPEQVMQEALDEPQLRRSTRPRQPSTKYSPHDLKCWTSIPFVELAGDETIMPLNINNELRMLKTEHNFFYQLMSILFDIQNCGLTEQVEKPNRSADLVSYNITHTMPAELGKLVNLTDMRMNVNSLLSSVNEHSPIQASSLEGTIPSSTASLTRLSDIHRNWDVVAIETGTVAGAVYVALLVLELRDLDLQTGLCTLKQMKAATKNFNAANNVGEGVFASVFKGSLSDGTVIAVMLLSSKSKQGNREFVNEIGMISALQHPNRCRVVWMLSWRKPINACVRVHGKQLPVLCSIWPMFCKREEVFPRWFIQNSSGEAMVILNVALLCTNASPTLWPTRSQVASMLEGQTSVEDLLSDPGFSAINTKYKAIRNHFWQNPSQTCSMSINGSYCCDSTNSYGEPGHLLRVSSVKSN
ncbi:hypothetical protein POTOM_057808 [Populus tomentosa]|uniref:Retroviral polymerase SH3-like domain-containing protein n=1 Tax=Populus tomentosa TaxID=118781 RepID=A0A8X8C2C3_POPTO|nr:hypothetical protein POTOM_057808 [Populus tomentosa]